VRFGEKTLIEIEFAYQFTETIFFDS